MKKLQLMLAGMMFVAVAAGALVAPLSRGSASAQLVQQGNNDAKQEEQQPSENNADEVTYKYVAQKGDSYSLMARKAIQTYGLTEKVDLSPAQIIFAETNLTLEAGSPAITRGQNVEIKESTVKSWVDKAKELSVEKQAAWDVYAQHANFNTDAVGQAS